MAMGWGSKDMQRWSQETASNMNQPRAAPLNIDQPLLNAPRLERIKAQYSNAVLRKEAEIKELKAQIAEIDAKLASMK